MRKRPRHRGPDFQLPIGHLLADLEAGTGSLQLSDEFIAASPAQQLCVVEAWERSLRDLAQDLQARLRERP